MDFVHALNANGVEYLLVGGYAVGVHGYVRATVDIDFLAHDRKTLAAAVVQAPAWMRPTLVSIGRLSLARPVRVRSPALR
jgi:hypothetical protein